MGARERLTDRYGAPPVRYGAPPVRPIPFLFLRDRAAERRDGLLVAGRLHSPPRSISPAQSPWVARPPAPPARALP